MVGLILGLVSSLFDSFFGFIFFGSAYLQLNRGTMVVKLVEMYSDCHQYQFYLCWAFLLKYISPFITSAFERWDLILGAGTFASVQSIIDDYAVGTIRAPFSCADNGL